ncbi:MAG: hypothetical protein ACIALR_01265 [Blastopirellula sp. JB062]
MSKDCLFARAALKSTLLIATCFLVGCSTNTDGIMRYELSGDVTFQGKPVVNGQITLEPDAQQGNKGPASTAVIKDGKYQVERPRGLVGGAYVARLTGYGAPVEGGGADVNYGPPLFENLEMRFKAPTENSTHSFDIPAEKK